MSVAVLAIFTAVSCGPALAASYKDLVPQEIKSSGILRIGSQQTYPPIEFRDPQTKEMVGLSVELLTEVANRLDLKIEWIQSDYGALITGAKASRFDIASGGISDQPEREKELDFVKSQLNIIQEIMGDDMPVIKDGKGIDIREYLKLKDKTRH